MRRIVAQRVLTDAATDALVGQHLTARAAAALNVPPRREDLRIERPDGSLLAVLCVEGIPRAEGEAMVLSVAERISTSYNRGKASGQQRIHRTLADGKVSKTNQTAEGIYSSVIGFYDRYPRMPFCRETAFVEQYPDAFARCLPAIRTADRLFKRHAPERHAVQAAVAARTHPDFVLPGTTFTTLTLNRNFRTAPHRDAGDLPEGFGVMTHYRSGAYAGGELAFPQYGFALALGDRDCVLFDPHEVHCNTPLRPLSPSWQRITCVHYYRAGMVYCGSAAQELARAKEHDPRRGPRAMKERPC